MEDFLYRGLWKKLDVRFSYVVCTEVANTAVRLHNCDPMSSHLLCRALASGLLTSPLLNEDEKYTIRWNYAGAAKTLIVDADSSSHVRGFIVPTNLTDYVASEADIYGETGKLTVIKSNAKRTLNSGVSDAHLLDVVDDLAYFFSVSDQLETAIVAMVGFSRDPERPVTLCQGLMLQAMPACDLEQFDRMRNRLLSDEGRNLLSVLQEMDNSFERILDMVAQGETEPGSYSISLTPAPEFRCTCSKKQMVRVVSTLERDEIETMLSEKGTVRVTCQFCSTQHALGREDLNELLGG